MDNDPSPYTYDQAAAVLGIQAEAVRARLRRGALRRGPRTNDSRPTVLLSQADITTIRSSIRTQPAEPGPAASPDGDGRPDERERTIEVLQGEAAALREALARERGRADQAAVTEAAARSELATERTRAAVAEAKLEAAEAALARERDRADRAEAEARRPWWKRLIGQP
ncbi:MAG: hypothetical protein EON48_03950 [Acetobacteraceae bacterium]|nr:MAG: hypothetical protein EON48_03950 [Acetobacteraceae bacterium]